MRLLLAEDERSLARALTVLLRKNNYEVDAVYDGEEAMAYLGSGNYDGAILDIMMPKRDGIDVLCQLRRQGNRLPVLLLTAKSEVDDKVLGLDSGANDYLTKPFASQELLARIRAMTREQTVQATSRLQVGNITLDRATFELSSPTGRLRLANKEFQMLELLMCNPRNLISTERFWRKSGGMTMRRRSTWSGSTSPICEKSSPRCMGTFRSRPGGTRGITWRRPYDPETPDQAGGGGHALFAGGADGDFRGNSPDQLSGNCL